LAPPRLHAAISFQCDAGTSDQIAAAQANLHNRQIVSLLGTVRGLLNDAGTVLTPADMPSYLGVEPLAEATKVVVNAVVVCQLFDYLLNGVRLCREAAILPTYLSAIYVVLAHIIFPSSFLGIPPFGRSSSRCCSFS
jgi:hypothetical protein